MESTVSENDRPRVTVSHPNPRDVAYHNRRESSTSLQHGFSGPSLPPKEKYHRKAELYGIVRHCSQKEQIHMVVKQE